MYCANVMALRNCSRRATSSSHGHAAWSCRSVHSSSTSCGFPFVSTSTYRPISIAVHSSSPALSAPKAAATFRSSCFAGRRSRSSSRVGVTKTTCRSASLRSVARSYIRLPAKTACATSAVGIGSSSCASASTSGAGAGGGGSGGGTGGSSGDGASERVARCRASHRARRGARPRGRRARRAAAPLSRRRPMRRAPHSFGAVPRSPLTLRLSAAPRRAARGRAIPPQHRRRRRG